MIDMQSKSCEAVEQIQVIDHIEMGKLLIRWAQDRESEPVDIEDFRRRLSGIAVIPERIKKLRIRGTELDTLDLRLPNPEIVADGIEKATDPMRDSHLDLPQFYSDIHHPGYAPVLSPLETLMARVSDCTLAQ